MLLFPKSREEWLDIRKQHVSSTESSALFGMSAAAQAGGVYVNAVDLVIIPSEMSTPMTRSAPWRRSIRA